MHIADGILPAAVWAPMAAVATLGVARGLRDLTDERLPAAALLAGVFFTASLVHVPVGPGSAHLVLSGLLGIMLGWAAFPVILIALGLQAVLFGFGGLLVLGVNVVNMALPAVLAGGVYRLAMGRMAPTRAGLVAGLCGASSVILSALMVGGTLALGGLALAPAAGLVIAANLPIAPVEGLVTAAAVGLLVRVRPGSLFQGDRG